MHGSKWPINSARIVQGGEVLFEAAEFEAVGLGGAASTGAFPYNR